MVRHFALAFAALSFLAPSARALTDKDFAKWYREALPQVEKEQYPKLRGMEKLRILMVGGYLGEVLKDKYFDVRRTIIETGAEPHKVSILTPVSINMIETNALKLKDEFEALTTAGDGERIVVIGHSKGAAEAMLALLQSDTTLRHRVAGVFLIQGAMNGSPIADVITGDGHAVDSGMASPYRQMLQAVLALDPSAKLAALEGYLGFKLGNGLHSLRTDNASALWEEALHKNPEGIKDLDGKTFYVRSYLPPQEVRTAFRVPAEYLSAYYGPNDGLLPLRSQTFGGFGRLLGTMRADHVALTKGHLPAGPERNRQLAFSVALARSIQALASELP